MSQQRFEVMGRTFRNNNDYMAAKRDEVRIEKIKKSVDFTTYNKVFELKKKIENDFYHFETLIGDDFYDEVCEAYDVLQVQGENKEKKNGNENDKKKANIERVRKKKESSFNINDYDEGLKNEIIRQFRIRERRRKALVFILGILAVSSITYVCYYYFYYQKNGVDYKQLSDLKNESSSIKVNLTEEKDKPPILLKYQTLYNKNKKLIGWLKIDDTNIDYPVMQTVNNEYYLDHNYNQEYDKNGSVFLDKDCNPAFPNTNMIIYGHHMKSGKMFGNLNYYSKESYFKEHPQIQFDTIYEEGMYEIMYVFRSRIYSEEEIVFKYYQFLDVTSADEFNSYMNEMQQLSLYETGVTAAYGDRLITLSTCDSSNEDGRFVVVAKKVK